MTNSTYYGVNDGSDVYKPNYDKQNDKKNDCASDKLINTKITVVSDMFDNDEETDVLQIMLNLVFAISGLFIVVVVGFIMLDTLKSVSDVTNSTVNLIGNMTGELSSVVSIIPTILVLGLLFIIVFIFIKSLRSNGFC